MVIRQRKFPEMVRQQDLPDVYERQFLVSEVKRWALALNDAIELNLSHLVEGRKKRLAEAEADLAKFGGYQSECA